MIVSMKQVMHALLRWQIKSKSLKLHTESHLLPLNMTVAFLVFELIRDLLETDSAKCRDNI